VGRNTPAEVLDTFVRLRSLARDLEYLEVKIYEDLNNQAVEVKRMLTGFIQKLTANCQLLTVKLLNAYREGRLSYD
jgi:hypothetical protein